MVLGTRNLIPVDAFYREKRGQSEGHTDEDLEKLRVTIQSDCPSKPSPSAHGQIPNRDQGGSQRGKDRSDHSHRRSLDPARSENEHRGHPNQYQFRD